MSFQSAYSLELKQYVTPKEAFDFLAPQLELLII